VRGSFQETASRKTAKNTVKHRGGGVDSMIVNHSDGSESSMVMTTLQTMAVNGVSENGPLIAVV